MVSDSERGGVLLLSPADGNPQLPVTELGGAEVGVQVQVEEPGRGQLHQAEEGKQTLRPISPFSFCLREPLI